MTRRKNCALCPVSDNGWFSVVMSVSSFHCLHCATGRVTLMDIFNRHFHAVKWVCDIWLSQCSTDSASFAVKLCQWLTVSTLVSCSKSCLHVTWLPGYVIMSKQHRWSDVALTWLTRHAGFTNLNFLQHSSRCYLGSSQVRQIFQATYRKIFWSLPTLAG